MWLLAPRAEGMRVAVCSRSCPWLVFLCALVQSVTCARRARLFAWWLLLGHLVAPTLRSGLLPDVSSALSRQLFFLCCHDPKVQSFVRWLRGSRCWRILRPPPRPKTTLRRGASAQVRPRGSVRLCCTRGTGGGQRLRCRELPTKPANTATAVAGPSSVTSATLLQTLEYSSTSPLYSYVQRKVYHIYMKLEGHDTDAMPLSQSSGPWLAQSL